MRLPRDNSLPLRQTLHAQPMPTVIELFLQVVDASPDAVAICSDKEKYTYRDLECWTRDIAVHLRSCGIKSGDVVGIVGTGSKSVAAFLGALRSGCVVLPLDPSTSEGKQKELLQIAEATAKITSIDKKNLDIEFIDATAGKSTLNYYPGQSEEIENNISGIDTAQGKDPAYIIFTSGSTGSPKGILGLHMGLSHFTIWQRDTFGIGLGDRVGQLANWSFEVLLREIFTPLISGATVCLPDDQVLNAENVFRFSRRHHLTVLHVVPSLVRHWLGRKNIDHRIPTTRITFFAGEPLHSELITSWRSKVAASTIVNLYGPTETTLAKFHYV
ncbi:AMP-binding protein, partial [Streptomyces sp. SID5770]|uniref:AMP-binding protein n=1 Tax=Streptomyces sp. SID5770 TaxID=2690308 RepID=UPI00136D4273